MEIKLRFNHNAKSEAEKWRLFINEKEILVGQVIFDKIEVATTVDVVDVGNGPESKYNVSCIAKNVFLHTVRDAKGNSLGISAIIQ